MPKLFRTFAATQGRRSVVSWDQGPVISRHQASVIPRRATHVCHGPRAGARAAVHGPPKGLGRLSQRRFQVTHSARLPGSAALFAQDSLKCFVDLCQAFGHARQQARIPGPPPELAPGASHREQAHRSPGRTGQDDAGQRQHDASSPQVKRHRAEDHETSVRAGVCRPQRGDHGPRPRICPGTLPCGKHGQPALARPPTRCAPASADGSPPVTDDVIFRTSGGAAFGLAW